MSETIDRRKSLGASSAAAAIGLSKWKTPYQLWREMAQGEEIDLSERLAIEVGNALEPVILTRFARNNNLTVTDQQRVIIDPVNPWRHVTLDGIASDGGLIEAKSLGFADPDEWGDEDTDLIPLQYFVQVQHSLSCTEAKFAHVPVVVLNRTERLYRIQRDNDFIADMIDKERQFMDMVRDMITPEPTSIADLKLLYPRDNGTSIVATAEAAAWIVMLDTTRKQKSESEKVEDSLKVKISAFMGDASEIVTEHGVTMLTNKAQTRASIDSKALRKEQPGIADAYTKVSEFRVIRCK